MLAVQNVIGGKPLNLPVVSNTRPTEQHAVIQVVFIDVLLNLDAVVPVQCDHDNIECLATKFTQPNDVIRTRCTERAPGRKEIDEHRPTGTIGKVVVRPIERRSPKRRRRLTVRLEQVAGLVRTDAREYGDENPDLEDEHSDLP